MRLTLLQMTFGKHIERKHCCFFAGEVGLVSSADRVTSKDMYWTIVLLVCILDSLGLLHTKKRHARTEICDNGPSLYSVQ
jgi:hypothetical protein